MLSDESRIMAGVLDWLSRSGVTPNGRAAVRGRV